MVRVLNVERFEKNKQALLNLNRERAEDLGVIPRNVTDSETLDNMNETCSALWGDGTDLHLVSRKRNHAMINALVGDLLDENTSDLVKALAKWSGLQITYERQGSRVTFRFQQAPGVLKELQIPMRHREPTTQYPVN